MTPGTIRIGTCSWTEKTLVESGRFYPGEVVTPEQRLRFYARHFDTVEVESSFYAIPTAVMVAAWIARTPERFLFHVKAHAAFTGHPCDARVLPGELRELLPAPDRERDGVRLEGAELLRALARSFTAALAPLREQHKLGFIVFQFPPWFGHSKANLAYLLGCRELMAGLPIAVEFRHRSWLTGAHRAGLFELLHRHGISYATCDEPQLGTPGTVPLIPAATTSIAYLRLHGRNAENWLDHSTPRYDYCYSPQELQALAGLVRRLSRRTSQVFVMFNNCHAGSAVGNALDLAKLIRECSGFIEPV